MSPERGTGVSIGPGACIVHGERTNDLLVYLVIFISRYTVCGKSRKTGVLATLLVYYRSLKDSPVGNPVVTGRVVRKGTLAHTKLCGTQETVSLDGPGEDGKEGIHICVYDRSTVQGPPVVVLCGHGPRVRVGSQYLFWTRVPTITHPNTFF